jgi:hypothetical protein
VLATDPNPLVNTVSATYGTTGPNGEALADTETATAHTDLFYPSVGVTKSCGPAQVEVGQNEQCTIVITNTSAGTTPPNLIVDSIIDTLSGDLTNSVAACGSLSAGASCTIVTNRTVQGSDPTPLQNTVTVHYHPSGFPNDITNSATAHVDIVAPGIKLTETVNNLSKPTDQITYHYMLCNTGNESVTRGTVISSVNGDITSLFPATLAVGACSSDIPVPYTVKATDPNPLVDNTLATYSGIVTPATSTSQGTTDLFYPSVKVTKSCSPNPLLVGSPEVCVIDVTNTSSGTTPPALVNGTINDSLNGDLLAAGNTAVTSSNCTTTLATGATCEITTSRVVSASDPNPLSNTVKVHYNPDGFPNSIDAQATATLPIFVPPPPVTNQCTLGFWKQQQHFGFWLGFMPNQLWNTVFLPITTVPQGSYPGFGPNALSLLKALQAGGGGINDFARHAVAELLNSSSLQHPDESTAQVISEVNAAITAYNNTHDVSILTSLAAKYDAQQQADNCTNFGPPVS